MKIPDITSNLRKNERSSLGLQLDKSNAPLVEKGLKSTILEEIAIAATTPVAEIDGSSKIGVTNGIMAAKNPVVDAKDEIMPPVYEATNDATYELFNPEIKSVI